MIDFDNVRKTVVKGLTEYLKCPVIRSNQNAEPPPYPYCSYTVTTLEKTNGGSWGRYADGKDRMPTIHIWSITVQSDNYDECLILAMKAKEWLDHTGTVYLNDNDVIVQKITDITNRDNLITIEYEYKRGFDVFFYLFDEVENPNYAGYIETVKTNNLNEE